MACGLILLNAPLLRAQYSEPDPEKGYVMKPPKSPPPVEMPTPVDPGAIPPGPEILEPDDAPAQAPTENPPVEDPEEDPFDDGNFPV